MLICFLIHSMPYPKATSLLGNRCGTKPKAWNLKSMWVIISAMVLYRVKVRGIDYDLAGTFLMATSVNTQLSVKTWWLTPRNLSIISVRIGWSGHPAIAACLSGKIYDWANFPRSSVFNWHNPVLMGCKNLEPRCKRVAISRRIKVIFKTNCGQLRRIVSNTPAKRVDLIREKWSENCTGKSLLFPRIQDGSDCWSCVWSRHWSDHYRVAPWA